jgi:hypothetical protein
LVYAPVNAVVVIAATSNLIFLNWLDLFLCLGRIAKQTLDFDVSVSMKNVTNRLVERSARCNDLFCMTVFFAGFIGLAGEMRYQCADQFQT